MAGRGATPSQTVGPFFAMKLAPAGWRGGDGPAGPRVRVEGRVLDGDGEPVEDALIESWQANAHGRYRHPADRRADAPLDPAFTGFARVHGSFDAGAFVLDTVKPGRVPAPGGGLQAPHLSLVLTARGLLRPCFTRLYFDDEAAANAEDPVLARVPASRRATLIARRQDRGTADPSTAVYRFDLRLQGDRETVFFTF